MSDMTAADQIALLTLTSALSQQQLNSAMARTQVAAAGNVLLLGIQTTHMAMLNQLTSLSPMTVAAMSNLLAAGNPSHIASLQTLSRVR